LLDKNAQFVPPI